MPVDKGEILIEFVALGGSVKVTAIDPATGAEASIVGPAFAPRHIGICRGAEVALHHREAGEGLSGL